MPEANETSRSHLSDPAENNLRNALHSTHFLSKDQVHEHPTGDNLTLTKIPSQSEGECKMVRARCQPLLPRMLSWM